MIRITIIIYSLLFINLSIAQGVGIGTTSPDPSALLHVKERNFKGVLIPRLSSEQINSIANPSKGNIVYETTSGVFNIFDGEEWNALETLPRGSIIMWNGSLDDIPSGWVLCNGESYDITGSLTLNGIETPDLRNKFIVSYKKSDPEYGQVSYEGGNDKTVLNTSQLPSHSHYVNSEHGHMIGISGSAHNLEVIVSMLNMSMMGGVIGGPLATYPVDIFNEINQISQTNSVDIEIEVASSKSNITIEKVGESKPFDNRPPYYVLAFLMKL